MMINTTVVMPDQIRQPAKARLRREEYRAIKDWIAPHPG